MLRLCCNIDSSILWLNKNEMVEFPILLKSKLENLVEKNWKTNRNYVFRNNRGAEQSNSITVVYLMLIYRV